MRNVSEDYEVMFTRRILCALVQQAVQDARDEGVYLRRYTQGMARKNREEAIHFIKSKAFDGICYALHIPTDRIRRAAYT
jgi:hypothetical protein